MSTTTTIPFPSPPPPPLSSATHYYITNLGLGYAIAIAFGFLVLFSSLLLASYICFRHRHSHRRQIRNPNGGGSDNGVMVPSIIFVGEDNNDDQNVVIGLDQSVINSYPKFLFTRGIPKAIDSVCAICLCEYREAEMMRMLPDYLQFVRNWCAGAYPQERFNN
ncbi:RING-H2 finger protein ATL68 isoform X2 [Cynara cardunculus var. scolymus]|uniref:RING-H2 finger protein ATL68 isoform X2 n=1 Tax=Cynara cardunculus var. scolymus TaxID=59895 RepID=UPI000D628965|nr:RING-H2 finger protein ATL68 isoform X2 [Cynara cardunculus var. scolymus]XP_024988383.1 RING-H2 finger protein ATL68 isoform X2 [Cynara cardunculus var. scolymus]